MYSTPANAFNPQTVAGCTAHTARSFVLLLSGSQGARKQLVRYEAAEAASIPTTTKPTV
jgi:hypothetical protein